MSEVDPEVQALVRAERIADAARLAGERGDAREASALYERACDWASAARQALRAGERLRAMELAAQAGDDTLCEGVLALLEGDRAQALAAAGRLSVRGFDRWAARLLEAGGDVRGGARAWERAGRPGRAAELLERAGDPAAAAKVLEAALRREPEAWSAAVALGGLLARFGKHEAAVRALQRVPADAPERRAALATLVPSLDRLGLSRAAREASAELDARGGPPSRRDPGPSAAGATPGRPRLFGRYEVLREAASTASARVLACTDVVRGEPVAVKIFAGWDATGAGRDALARFEREVRTMRALDHPNIVPLRDYVPEGPALVLAWMSGGTLERLLATAGRLPPARAVEIAAGVLLALAEAHRVGIVHRDVKPSNVLFDEAGGARLSDFGVAHLGDASTTVTAGVFGTLAYMSPEQREGRPATARSDLYAVGVMLREMLTGSPPLPSLHPLPSLASAHAQLDARHDAIVARLAAEAPGDRPADALSARAALLALPWPADVDARAAGPRAERRSSARPEAVRLAPGAPGAPAVDVWMQRPVVPMPLTDARLARARAFARAGHPALQTIYRVDREGHALWLEALPDTPLAGPLTAPQQADLAAALAALHAAGGVHGAVGAGSVTLVGERAVLRFHPDVDPTATADRDRLALARL